MMTFVDNGKHILTELLNAEKARTCGQESSHSYAEMHRARFGDILRLCRSEVPDASARVLDIGRSELTVYLLSYYRTVHTLGLDPSVDDGGHRETTSVDDAVSHITFDLLKADDLSNWPDGCFDLIVFSEVIEHLCVAPEYVFGFLRSLLARDGVLVCTTPNAADIAKRIRLICGRNPYERLRLYSNNPGHVREYTRRELCEIADSVGLRCTSHSYFNWIQKRDGIRLTALIARVLRLYPPFRGFQACTLTQRAADAAHPNDDV